MQNDYIVEYLERFLCKISIPARFSLNAQNLLVEVLYFCCSAIDSASTIAQVSYQNVAYMSMVKHHVVGGMGHRLLFQLRL